MMNYGFQYDSLFLWAVFMSLTFLSATPKLPQRRCLSSAPHLFGNPLHAPADRPTDRPKTDGQIQPQGSYTFNNYYGIIPKSEDPQDNCLLPIHKFSFFSDIAIKCVDFLQTFLNLFWFVVVFSDSLGTNANHLLDLRSAHKYKLIMAKLLNVFLGKQVRQCLQ